MNIRQIIYRKSRLLKKASITRDLIAIKIQTQ